MPAAPSGPHPTNLASRKILLNGLADKPPRETIGDEQGGRHSTAVAFKLRAPAAQV